jgi:hypothetical protein
MEDYVSCIYFLFVSAFSKKLCGTTARRHLATFGGVVRGMCLWDIAPLEYVVYACRIPRLFSRVVTIFFHAALIYVDVGGGGFCSCCFA